MAFQPEIERWLMQERKALGQRIRQARQDAGLTQEEFGAKVGLSNAAVSAIELGKTAIRLEDILLYSRLLAKPLIYFLPQQPGLDVEEHVLLEDLRDMTAEERATVLSMLKFIHQERRKRGQVDTGGGEGVGDSA